MFQKFSTFDLLYLNSINSIFLLIILDVFDDEIFDVFAFCNSEERKNDELLYVFFGLVIGFGVAFTFFQFVCTTTTSALSTTVAGSAKSTIAAFIGSTTGLSYLMDGELNAFNILGMLLNWAGATLFLYNGWNDIQSHAKTTW